LRAAPLGAGRKAWRAAVGLRIRRDVIPARRQARMSGSGHERPNETIDFESALTSNVLQNYFERRSEEYPRGFK